MSDVNNNTPPSSSLWQKLKDVASISPLLILCGGLVLTVYRTETSVNSLNETVKVLDGKVDVVEKKLILNEAIDNQQSLQLITLSGDYKELLNKSIAAQRESNAIQGDLKSLLASQGATLDGISKRMDKVEDKIDKIKR